MLDVFRISGLSALAGLTLLGVGQSSAGHGYLPPWYDQPPLVGTGPGLYYSYHPTHVPGYPEQLRGYPVPIYSTARPVRAFEIRDAWDAHIQWCYTRWLTYRQQDNTYQPSYGPRRQCRSPY